MAQGAMLRSRRLPEGLPEVVRREPRRRDRGGGLPLAGHQAARLASCGRVPLAGGCRNGRFDSSKGLDSTTGRR
jgi:hypothetical protein